MRRSRELKVFLSVLFAGILGFSLPGCSSLGGGNRVQGYPIDATVVTTASRTIAFPAIKPGLPPQELSRVAHYDQYGYGRWTFETGGLAHVPRADAAPSGIMPAGYVIPEGPPRARLLNFFALTDVHITDEESPAQLIHLQQLYRPVPLPPPFDLFGNYPWSWQTSVYSPVMLYTTQVLDAAVQTINALHQQPGNGFDFGISLGDVSNSAGYNELRWYIDVLDGKLIHPSSGAHAGADTIDYQKPFKAAGLDTSIPWYQALGNHDHFFIGSFPVDGFLRQAAISDEVIATGDVLLNPANLRDPRYYMGVIDGSTPYGEIRGAGPVVTFNGPPKVVADPDRRSLLRTEWIHEFFSTTSVPVGHGFDLVAPGAPEGFACYSFAPKSPVPIKVIVLDDTQMETDGDTGIHGYGFLDAARWAWLKKELADGDAARQLMIIAAHVPIGVQPLGSHMEWWDNSANRFGTQNAVTLNGLITELQRHPNLLMWISGHLHQNTVKAFPGPTPEQGFWEIQTSSLRDFPQQFRTFEIHLNGDYTISIVATNVDPAVGDGTPAATSRAYAVAAQQICGNPTIYQNSATVVDLMTQARTSIPDASISAMPDGSYNAILYKRLSPAMRARMQALFP